MLQNIAAQADSCAGESAKFAGYRQKSVDCSRRFVRPLPTIFRSQCVKPADGVGPAQVTMTLREAGAAYRQALREGDDLALLALTRLGSQLGYPVPAYR